MSKKPKRFLLFLVFICVPLIGGFSYWWLTTPSQTITTFIDALREGDTNTINALLENPYEFEISGDKLGFIGFKENSPKRKLKIWQDALKKALKVKERNLDDWSTGKAQATLRVESTVKVYQGRIRVKRIQKKSLEPKTLKLTIIAHLNKITLKQELEEPNESNIILLFQESF